VNVVNWCSYVILIVVVRFFETVMLDCARTAQTSAKAFNIPFMDKSGLESGCLPDRPKNVVDLKIPTLSASAISPSVLKIGLRHMTTSMT